MNELVKEETNNKIPEFSLKERYELLIKARNFHYENFNKWMSYFYVMIASVILGFSYIISKESNYYEKYETELILLGFIGFVISLFWHWANKGYYYWNINFITLVNYYEKHLLKFDENERVYFVFANKKMQNNYLSPLGGANISTSKISILLSYFFTIFFGSFVVHEFFKECISCKPLLIVVCILISSFTVFLLSISVAKFLLSSYNNHIPDLEIDSSMKNNFETKERIKL